MTLAAGTKLGVYEILSPLGAGGMGEVYRARDTKLQRDVALKILPETMARDAQRMARFEREAHVLASLNHPNIAAIYGLEESNGVRALVMELVEGETLAERIGRPDASVAPGFGRQTPENAGLKSGSTVFSTWRHKAAATSTLEHLITSPKLTPPYRCVRLKIQVVGPRRDTPPR